MSAHDDFLPTRRSLISRLRNLDDNETWSDFFHTYGKLLYAAAVKSGLTDAEAQDVVQDTVISVAKQIPGFRYDPNQGSFKGWLHTILRRRIVDYIRTRAGRGRQAPAPSSDTPVDLDALADPMTNALDRIWNEEWERHRLDRAVEQVRRQVSPRQFQIFDAYVLKALPLPEVCRTLGVSRAHVYVAKHRVMRLLKKVKAEDA
jgi:RNA polymerase sigma-70 factor (ECF subfamily)